ncbi:MAG: hypothetical protein LRS46_03890 [Desulfurococcales archaeon]|nr:hypothetical protein [Desulfurococcales archaeon]
MGSGSVEEGYSRNKETVAALIDDIIIIDIIIILISFILNKIGLLGLRGLILVAVIATVAIALIAGAIYRVHRRKPAVGMEALVGLTGVAYDRIPPKGEGIVLLEGELWRAINVGEDEVLRNDKVVVVGIEGLTLKVKKFK